MFFSFEFVFMIAFVYFLSAFCAVYHSSQWNWFSNSITSIVISLIITLATTLVISLLRWIGIYCKNEKIYNTSLYLGR